jgi:hypothetical protein
VTVAVEAEPQEGFGGLERRVVTIRPDQPREDHRVQAPRAGVDRGHGHPPSGAADPSLHYRTDRRDDMRRSRGR